MPCLTGQAKSWRLSIGGITRLSRRPWMALTSMILFLSVTQSGMVVWPRRCQAFLHEHASKLEGKRVALFATSGSSGISTSAMRPGVLPASNFYRDFVADVKRACPDGEPGGNVA